MQSVFGLTLLSEEAQDWVEEEVQTESWQWFGDTLIIEHRYIEEIVEEMLCEGFEEGTDFRVD